MASYEMENVGSSNKTNTGNNNFSEKSNIQNVYEVASEPQVGQVHTVHRDLKSRHLQMIAIGGTIGTGLFIGSGNALRHGGPVGALLGYIFMGVFVYFMMLSLGEMTAWMPAAGGFTRFTTQFIDPAAGFAVGWNYFYCFAITLPAEITAASIVIQYWDTNTNHLAIYITIMLVAAVLINLFGAKGYGESEFWLAIIKVLAIVGLIFLGLLLDMGVDSTTGYIGFRYWKEPGAFNKTYLDIANAGTARFLGFWATLTQAAFSYLGVEIVCVTAGEAQNPRRNVPKAIRRVIYRIAIFYYLGILVIGLLVPYNSPRLLSALAGKHTAAASPFVLAIKNAGIPVLPHIINAVILSSAFSAGNSDLYTSSRTLYALAIEGKAPRIFARCTASGLPYYAVGFTSLFGLLSYLNLSSGSSAAFGWLSNLTTVAGLFTWTMICWSYIRFYNAMKVQNFDRKQLPMVGFFQPYAAYICVVIFPIIIFFNGFSTMVGTFAAQDFVAAYIGVPIFFIPWIVYKIYYRTKMVPLESMDIIGNAREVDQEEKDNPAFIPTTWYGKTWAAVM
ncbi:Predicted protein [Taphrina deformans PYCC 5710]|uniref:Amino acid permease/ SLC12A domain-containing protein n=1 Tax=Taphrina deformans (strain PYCC 5710 / ATCC 11124 / CBS 356.35 / IMI 108563 / JCM 9778 / NBRC 8474) TaxID=1097556 RepID=R4XCQ5_TAPDE|nr:Predicted protein [Taphrina deformans PYCC 5710]|eukprot:CCG81090.1 Predicted protein [Taphrina deformans PYCC 5710]